MERALSCLTVPLTRGLALCASVVLCCIIIVCGGRGGGGGVEHADAGWVWGGVGGLLDKGRV